MSFIIHQDGFEVSPTPKIGDDKCIMIYMKYKYEPTVIKTIVIHGKPLTGMLWIHHHSTAGIKLLSARQVSTDHLLN